MPNEGLIEKLSEEFHKVYVNEQIRQSNEGETDTVRWAQEYKDLPDNIKNLDRALAKYVLALLPTKKEIIEIVKIQYEFSVENEPLDTFLERVAHAISALYRKKMGGEIK